MFDALEADFNRALDLRCDALTAPERLALLQRCERIRRRLPAIEHPIGGHDCPYEGDRETVWLVSRLESGEVSEPF